MNKIFRQPPFPEWCENLPPLDQKIARQQHHLCCWGYSHHSGTELLQIHGPSPPRCNSLLWLNVLLAGDWGWRHWEPFYLSYHEPPLDVEWQRHTYSFLLDTKPLWHRRKWKSWPAGEETLDHDIDHLVGVHYADLKPLLNSYIQQLFKSSGCRCTWQRSLSRETNTGSTEEIPALNQSWRACNNPTSNWPCKGHQIPYLVPSTADCLSPFWSNTDHWPYVPGVCSITGMSRRVSSLNKSNPNEITDENISHPQCSCCKLTPQAIYTSWYMWRKSLGVIYITYSNFSQLQ